MDLLIEKNGLSNKLSSLGLLVLDVEDTAPEIEINKRHVKSRSGAIFSGARFTEKMVHVSGTFEVSNVLSYEEKKDEINGLLSDDEPFYITKMYPSKGDFYEFERPGQTTKDLNYLIIPHSNYKYRYKVLLNSQPDYSFAGKSNKGLVFVFSLLFVTTDLPFGQTVPVNKTVTGISIPYQGSAKCDQLVWPWYLKLKSTEAQTGSFSVTIEGRTFQHTSLTQLKVGDEFHLKGFETTLNGSNVNNYTNYEHFILRPKSNNLNSFSTTFKGTVELINFVELYM